MPQWAQILIQVLLQVGGAYLSTQHGTPTPSIGAGVAGAALGVISQHYNTDGTPQSVAYTTKK